MKVNRQDMVLYGVTDRSWLGESTLYQQVEQALKGGATFIQLREKDLDEETFLQEALEIKDLCKTYHVPFVINDNVNIAKQADADGVHVGQGDMEIADAREILGADKIIGVSVKTVEQALLAQAKGADYLGVGAVFRTGTKKDATCISETMLRDICQAVSIPVVAIGGISTENVMDLSGSGIDGVAVVSAIFSCENIEEGTRRLKKQVEQLLKGKE